MSEWIIGEYHHVRLLINEIIQR